MSIEGFHVSTNQYRPGQVVRVDPGQVTHFQAALEKSRNVAGEERLERHRPSAAPSRKTSVYLFETLEICSLYGSSQHKEGRVSYYRVEADKTARVPMVLVDAIRRQANPTDGHVERMVREYWHPTLGWEIWEHLADAIEILEEVKPFAPHSFEVMGAQGSYTDDNDMANRFCAATMQGKEL
jgi:hypothetical protein